MKMSCIESVHRVPGRGVARLQDSQLAVFVQSLRTGAYVVDEGERRRSQRAIRWVWAVV